MPKLTLFNKVYRITSWMQPQKIGSLDPAFFATIGNGLEITDLRVQFKVDRQLAKEPNSAEVTITNAAADTRAQLCRKPSQVRIEAGYADSGARLLFVGDLRYGASKLTGTDWETKMQVADGGRAFTAARANRSFKSPITVHEVLTYAASTMNLKLPPEIEQDPEMKAALANGISVHGASQDVLTRLLAPFGYGWSVQNGRLQIIKDNQVVQGRDWVISTETGLIGSPEIAAPDKNSTTSEVHFDVALFPELTPGQSVKVESSEINGRYKLIQVTHTGDSRGDDWKTSCKGVPV